MRTLEDVVAELVAIPPQDLHLVGEALVLFSPSTAEALKNAIGYAQQEEDMRFLELERQHAMMQAAEDSANLDAAYYGERV